MSKVLPPERKPISCFREGRKGRENRKKREEVEEKNQNRVFVNKKGEKELKGELEREKEESNYSRQVRSPDEEHGHYVHLKCTNKANSENIIKLPNCVMAESNRSIYK